MAGRGMLVLVIAACHANGNTSATTDAGVDAGADAASRCGDGNVDPGEQCDDGNAIAFDGCTGCTIDGTAAVDATWRLQTVTGVAVACPSGVDSATVTATPIDYVTSLPTGPAIASTFDCADGIGTTMMLPIHIYSVQLALSNYAVSLAKRIDLTDGIDKPFDALFITDGGSFTFSYTLVKTSDPSMALTCDQITNHAQGYDMQLSTTIALDGTHAFPVSLSCLESTYTSPPFAVGSYTIELDANEFMSDFLVELGRVTIPGQVIVAPSGGIDLGTIAIPIRGF